jgi:hypothetical protein
MFDADAHLRNILEENKMIQGFPLKMCPALLHNAASDWPGHKELYDFCTELDEMIDCGMIPGEVM